jgi:D-alanyl-D-alanine carboxypeptidase
LEEMLAAARQDGQELFIVSAFRSFTDQMSVKSGYTVRYGTTAANSFSADQGYSEHQLGTTVDVTTRDIGAGLAGFSKTDEYRWLRDNAYLYGFVLSYPEENDFYQFEPWHWRFVGRELARVLHERNEYFYDMDQRAIDDYLISLFD